MTPSPESTERQTAGLLRLESESFPLIAEKTGTNYPALVGRGMPGAGYMERNLEASDNLRHAVNCWNSYARHFGEHAVAAAESDALGEALDIIRALLDLQNGCPLPKYETDFERENARARSLLDRALSKEPII